MRSRPGGADEDAIEELQVVRSTLHAGGYEAFPAGDAVTAIAEETVEEEMPPMKVKKRMKRLPRKPECQ